MSRIHRRKLFVSFRPFPFLCMARRRKKINGEMMLTGMLGTGSDSGCASHKYWKEARRFRFWIRRLEATTRILWLQQPSGFCAPGRLGFSESQSAGRRPVHSPDNCAPAVLCNRNPKSDPTSKQQLAVMAPRLATFFFIWLHISIVFL